MNKGDSIFNGLLSKPLVDVSWGEKVFVAVGDLSEVKDSMDCRRNVD